MAYTLESDKTEAISGVDALSTASVGLASTSLSDVSHAAEPGTTLPAHCSGDILRSHVEARIDATTAIEMPFRHLFIEDVFPDDFYTLLRSRMLAAKHSGDLQDRLQDNLAFKNKRFNLSANRDPIVNEFRSIFTSPEIKRSLIKKFYHEPHEGLAQDLIIHDEFEFFFTKAGRFQNIHVDIPPKYLSFVFYMPEHICETTRQEFENATILYDRNLKPHYSARFRANSVCVFAPHFHSYHGFNSTVDRDVLVMFYVNPSELARWRELRQTPEAPPFEMVRDVLENKVRRYPLIEYGRDVAIIKQMRNTCRINAPQGRVVEG